VAFTAVFAHPGSGIVVDRRGQIYFIDTGQGVWRIDAQGRLAQREGPAFHWLAIDTQGRFVKTRLPSSTAFSSAMYRYAALAYPSPARCPDPLARHPA